MNRLSLSRRINKIARKSSQENANKSWLQRNAESIGLILEASDSEEVCRATNNRRQRLHILKSFNRI
uniref:Uncharacterized protein n=1 Tax=Arundo donax TaxID=35708 RepID=A0A0A9G4A4_ARUDO